MFHCNTKAAQWYRMTETEKVWTSLFENETRGFQCLRARRALLSYLLIQIKVQPVVDLNVRLMRTRPILHLTVAALIHTVCACPIPHVYSEPQTAQYFISYQINNINKVRRAAEHVQLSQLCSDVPPLWAVDSCIAELGSFAHPPNNATVSGVTPEQHLTLAILWARVISS